LTDGADTTEGGDRVSNRGEGAVSSASSVSSTSSKGGLDLWRVARLEVSEALRARWFALYSIVFGGLVGLLFIFGLTESHCSSSSG